MDDEREVVTRAVGKPGSPGTGSVGRLRCACLDGCWAG